MKRILSLTLIAGILFLFGCTKNGATTPEEVILTTGETIVEQAIQRQTYESKSDGFFLQYPGDRTFQENAYESSVIFFSPLGENDQIQENFGILKTTLPQAYTLKEYYDITKPQLIQRIPEFTEVVNETIKINDMDAQKLIYKGLQGTTKLQWEQVYIIKDKNVYIATYTATENTFNEFVQRVDEMIATIEIK